MKHLVGQFSRIACLGLIATALVSAQGLVFCSVEPVAATYSLGPGNDGNQATGSGPFHLTATPSTFSYVQYLPSGPALTFADLTSLSANFVSNSGGSGGGAPRLSVRLFDGVTQRSLLIYLGNSPNFTDTDAVLNTWSGVNLIGNNDAGRYDTSAFPGGSPFSTYAAALALLGSQQVVRVTYILDTFSPFPNRDETLNSINLIGNVCQDYSLFFQWFFLESGGGGNARP